MTYNASLNRGTPGQLQVNLATPDNAQAQAVAEVIQRNDPDVLLVNEFDHDDEGRSARLFHDNYLAVGQDGQAPVHYPYVYAAPVNTGVPSGLDLNQDGAVGGGDDAWGFGQFPGQYGMVLYSKHPIDTAGIRTFQHFRWADMPNNLLPAGFYRPEQAEQLRLSSKSHWDVPVRIGHKTVHVLASHPTPPSFDGPEDRNGRRNHDEIRFWADYVSNPARSSYIYDDTGARGGLEPGERFVVMGDQNSDPHDGDSWPGAIQQLLGHPRVQDPLPASAGGPEAAARQGGANLVHVSDPAYDTADFNDHPAPGNLRVDYVLPSKNLRVLGAGVWWPAPGEPGAELTGEYPFPASDHRPVYVDISVAGRR
ncbi:endonuclease/exonuclease/phosphatase family protein [Kocuria rosea]|uniref:Endonuclease/exonuclease/phosphatase family protein n=2 Tax=Kocuria rosea TaxID=1275 RepID=A0A4R5YR27_KOCRO|nr:endonuclease/exonuclease/phosphatase family protein [Kocuria rosea]